jgi:hypothetical protein
LRVANDEQPHVALPKLYGAPAYARPLVAPVAPTERPIDPDDLPLESEQTEEEHDLARRVAARPFDGSSSTGSDGNGKQDGSILRGRPFRFRAITGLVRGSNQTSTEA